MRLGHSCQRAYRQHACHLVRHASSCMFDELYFRQASSFMFDEVSFQAVALMVMLALIVVQQHAHITCARRCTATRTPAQGQHVPPAVSGTAWSSARASTPAHLAARRPMASAGVAGLDVETLTIVDILAGLKNGSFTAEELTSAYLAQIARYEGVYNAFTFIAPDALAQVPVQCFYIIALHHYQHLRQACMLHPALNMTNGWAYPGNTCMLHKGCAHLWSSVVLVLVKEQCMHIHAVGLHALIHAHGFAGAGIRQAPRCWRTDRLAGGRAHRARPPACAIALDPFVL